MVTLAALFGLKRFVIEVTGLLNPKSFEFHFCFGVFVEYLC